MKFDDCIRCKVSIRRMDGVGSQYGVGDMESQDCHLSSLKLVNVPSMFDIGGAQPNPTTDSLSMTFIDNFTFKLV